ncbi:MAG: lipopolysaccharide biosynthesis protein [Chitinophagaceae bacterium]
MRPIIQSIWLKYVIPHQRYWLNLVSSFFAQGIAALSVLWLTPFLLNVLGEQSFSVYGILILNLLPFSLIFDLGYNMGLLRRLIHEPEKASSLISGGCCFFLGLLPITFGVYSALSHFGLIQNTGFTVQQSLLLSLLVVLQLGALLFDIVLQSVNKIFLGKSIRVVKTILETLAVYIGATRFGLQGVFVALVLTNFLYLVALYWFSKRERSFELHWRYCKWKDLIHHFKYSIWFFLAACSGVLVYNAQTILMGNLLDAQAVSKYVLITRFYEVVRIGMGNFTLILFPTIAILESSNSWKQLFAQFKTVALRITVLCVIAVFILLTIGKYLFVAWSGMEDQEILFTYIGYTFLILLLIIEHVPVVFLTALKMNRYPTIVSMVQGILGLMLSYWLIPIYGILGVVIASIAALTVTSLWFSFWYLFQQLQHKLSHEPTA